MVKYMNFKLANGQKNSQKEHEDLLFGKTGKANEIHGFLSGLKKHR